MENYYKNEPLRTYGVPIRSRDYVEEYDSMSTGDRIADVLAGLQQSSINRRSRDLAFLGDLQDFASTKTPTQRDNALMGARTLTPLEEEVQALVDREEGKSFDIDAILAEEAPRPGEERREMARELQMPKMSEEELKEMANEPDEEAERQARIQAIKDSNAELIAKRSQERGGPRSPLDPSLGFEITPAGGPPEAGTISFSGKSLDQVLAEIQDKPAAISEEDMANRIIARREDPRNKFAQFY
jgi:hypothetical protein